MPHTFSGLPPIQPLRSGVGEVKAKVGAGEGSESLKEAQKLRRACSELESLFIFHLFKEMRATIPKTGFLSGGKGEELYTSMLDAQVAREMAAERGMGLSRLLMERLEGKTGPEKKDDEK